MRIIFVGVPALWPAGCAGGQADLQSGALEAQAKMPAYRITKIARAN
jgi:hypothetical protein